MLLKFSNNAQTTLAGSISDSAIVINVAPGGGAEFPTIVEDESYFVATLTDAATGLLREVVWVVTRVGDTMGVIRAQEGTTALAWQANDLFANLCTAGQMATMVQNQEAQSQAWNYGVDTGTANSYLVALDPVLEVPVEGMPLRVLIDNDNSGASTIDYGAGAVAIVRTDGSALIGGELLAGSVADLLIRASDVQLVGIAPATDAAIAAGTDTNSAVTPAQLATFSSLFSGAMVWAARLSAPTGFLLSYGQDVSRATYATLFAAITRSSNVTISIATPAVVSWTGHGLKIGDKVSFETTGVLPTGITGGTNYYVISAGFTANAFQFSASFGGAAVDTTLAGSGTQSCRFNPYGCGNGSTTFTLPEGNGVVPGGIDDLGGSAAGNLTGAINLGAIVGDEADTVTSDPSGGNINTANNAGQSTAPGSHTHDVTVSTVQATLMLNCFIKT